LNIAELGYLPLPSECGYLSVHHEPRYVRGCAFKSIDAFVTLATICSFAIAANVSLSDKYLAEPDWVTACQNEGVHRQWLKDLQELFVCNFSPGMRCGAFMHRYKSYWGAAIPAFFHANVPLWIFWGNSPLTPIDRKLSAHRPLKEEVTEAKHFATASSLQQPVYEGRDHHAERQPSSNPDVITTNDSINAPDPQPGSRQLKGETLHQFCLQMESD
jgi:hypothetical protein